MEEEPVSEERKARPSYAKRISRERLSASFYSEEDLPQGPEVDGLLGAGQEKAAEGEDPQEADVAAVAAEESSRRSFSASAFKRLYDEQSPPEYQHELFAAVMSLLVEYAAEVGGGKDGATQLFEALQVQAFNCQQWSALLGQVEAIAVVLWTSASLAGLGVEFCSILNHVIRQDSGDALPHAVVLSRAMALLMVSRRTSGPSATRWPEDHQSHRGTGMPEYALGFFVEGLLYRAPMFLATSFFQQKAYEFMQKVRDDKVPVHFIFHLDPVKRCDHALFLQDLSLSNGEHELLYAPYSAFRVLKVSRPDGPTWDNPVIIELIVQTNNKTVPEDVPVAEWH